jgi:CBS domain containing-hemolysin-like protein
LIVAAAFCLLYLLFDAVRSLAVRIGPVRLRSLVGERAEPTRWYQFDALEAGTVAGVLLQVSMVFGVGFTIGALWPLGATAATLISAVAWSLIAVMWKMVVEALPDEFGEQVFRLTIPVTAGFYYAFWPVVYPLIAIIARSDVRRDEEQDEEEASEEEVQAYIDVGEEEGILEEGEGKLLQSIVDFGDTLAHEVMTPRIDMLAFDVDQPFDALATLFSESKYARIPVYQANIDRIVGIVHVKDVLDAHLKGLKPPLIEIARPVYFVTATKKLSELLRELQVEHQQIAVVLDEYGGTAGLITFEDVIEEIVGEISDEHEDSDESIVEVEDDVYLVNGLLRIETLEEQLGVKLEGEHYETVAGLIATTLGRVAKVGEQVSRNGIAFEVKHADRKRIYRVRVSREPVEAAETRNGRARAE